MSRYRFVLALAMVVSLIMVSAGGAEAKTKKKVKGSSQGTGVTSAFSFDGAAPAFSIISTGRDNLGGKFNGQDVGEYLVTTTPCTAPDGSAGTEFDLVQAAEVVNYEDGQLYSIGAGTGDGTGCASSTTGSYGLTESHTVIGGTGKFANAAGTIVGVVVGNTLAAPGNPPGKLGLFSGFQSTFTGSVTY
jgi:hypothetical protein